MLQVKTFQVTVIPRVISRWDIFLNQCLGSCVPVLMGLKSECVGSGEEEERNEGFEHVFSLFFEYLISQLN